MAMLRYKIIRVVRFRHTGTFLSSGLNNFFDFTGSFVLFCYRVIKIIGCSVDQCSFRTRRIIPGLPFNIRFWGALPLRYIYFSLSPGNNCRSPSGSLSLVFEFKRRYVIIFFTRFVIKMVLRGVDNYHRMPNRSGYLVFICSDKSHVGNKIRDFAHLRIGLLHDWKLPTIPIVMLCSIRIDSAAIRPIIHLGVESNQSFQRRSRRDLNLASLVVSRNTHYSVPIIVSP